MVYLFNKPVVSVAKVIIQSYYFQASVDVVRVIATFENGARRPR